MGSWKVSLVNGQAAIQWNSNTNGPGSVFVHTRNDGVVTDPRGNPFIRVGQAQCQ